MKFNFYATDDDRSCGWTNHGFALQFVCSGNGSTPKEAWEDAEAHNRVPDLDDGSKVTADVAIPDFFELEDWDQRVIDERHVRVVHGREAMEAGTPDFAENDTRTNGVDAITNILHALCEDLPFDENDPKDHAAGVIRQALAHFVNELRDA